MHNNTHSSRRLFGAAVDQAAISAANFLVIALGAWMLSMDEQSKLAYVYTAYIAVVLMNASAIFSAAPMLRQDIADADAYRRLLLQVQILISLSGSALVVAIFHISGALLDWAVTVSEMAWIFSFLVIQQFSDFNRRSGYVFGGIKSSSFHSIFMLMTRVVLVLFVKPSNAEDFFVLLSISALPGAVAAFSRTDIGNILSLDVQVLSRHFRLARLNIICAPLLWLCLHLPVFLVGALSGNWAAAVLASIRSVSTIANVMLEMIETYLPNWMITRMRESERGCSKELATSIYKYGGSAWLFAALVIVFIGEEILAVILGESYSDYWGVLFLLWVGNGLYFLGRIYGIQHRVARRTSVELVGAIAGVVILVLTIPLYDLYGVYGAAWSIVLIQAGVVVLQRVYVRRLKLQ